MAPVPTKSGGAEEPDLEIAMLRFVYKMPGPVTVSRPVAGGRVAIDVPMQGYGFPWGQIIEREGQIWVFDFYLALQQEVLRRVAPAELQERVVAGLEEVTDCTVRDHGLSVEALNGDGDLWRIVPAALGHGAVFSVLCHFAATQQLRNWLIGEFLPEILPDVLARVREGLDQDG
jgi:hypothetical protein